MFVQVGQCPHCGAPLWSPATWGSILPPPVQRSCSCNSSKKGYLNLTPDQRAERLTESLDALKEIFATRGQTRVSSRE